MMNPKTVASASGEQNLRRQWGSRVSKQNAILTILAILYPLGNFFLLRGIGGVPDQAHWWMFGIVLPAVCATVAIVVKAATDARRGWMGVCLFFLWMVLLGWFNRWLIEAVWASI